MENNQSQTNPSPVIHNNYLLRVNFGLPSGVKFKGLYANPCPPVVRIRCSVRDIVLPRPKGVSGA
jgi:hypothetical protein